MTDSKTYFFVSAGFAAESLFAGAADDSAGLDGETAGAAFEPSAAFDSVEEPALSVEEPDLSVAEEPALPLLVAPEVFPFSLDVVTGEAWSVSDSPSSNAEIDTRFTNTTSIIAIPNQTIAVHIVTRVKTSPALAPNALDPPMPPNAPASPPPRPR